MSGQTTIDGKHETSLTEHHDAQVRAPAFPEKGGLLTQFDGTEGADLLNSMHRVAPDVFTTAANGATHQRRPCGSIPTMRVSARRYQRPFTVRDVMGLDTMTSPVTQPSQPLTHLPQGEAQINLFSRSTFQPTFTRRPLVDA